MAIMKPLYSPHPLLILQALQPRFPLSDDQQHYLSSLKKGIEGERQWASYLKTLPEEVPILFDLTLEISHTIFQIDALCILQNKLVLFEIKNFRGDFKIIDDKWYSSANNEIKNPLLQLERSTSLFQQFLRKHQLSIPFEYLIIFPHPEFVLYGAIPKETIIFPGQIPRLLEQLNSSNVTHNHHHKNIIDTLLAQHIDNFTLPILKPKFQYDDLLKGIFCNECDGILEKTHYKAFKCTKCHQTSTIEKVLLKNVHDYTLLFPERRKTTPNLYEWLDGQISRNTLKRFLNTHFVKKGQARATFYE